MYLESNAKEVRSCINIVARMIDTAYSLFKLRYIVDKLKLEFSWITKKIEFDTIKTRF